MIVRSGAMGEFVFTPAGLDVTLIREAGFADVRVADVTENPARVAAAWHAARERRAAQLDQIQGADQNASTQRFLSTVAMLARERRLSASRTSRGGPEPPACARQALSSILGGATSAPASAAVSRAGAAWRAAPGA